MLLMWLFHQCSSVYDFSERDGHSQAVEKHRASSEKSHADCLPAGSVQVCRLYIDLLMNHVTF